MFKKLKEKITEEVKSSPQRFAEFTQSVSDRLQNSTSSDDNFFSIGEDDANTSANTSTQGFSSVTLMSPSDENRSRRLSNSSMASDISFLPRYEASSMYHLQSDLDISASEIEDNVSTASSQLGHLSKEQIYSAFQKSQMRYHKYRGRYTDLARHYKDLERENGKMKSVLVETQDKAIRRITELKEQCNLEQRAKAHLESALRDEIDEKNYKIKTLQTKIELLQNDSSSSSLLSTETKETDNQSDVENLTKHLNDARKEIQVLNEKIQELKANSIVYQSKEHKHESKICDLEKEIAQCMEREKENNLKFAENKMELHNEILSKETEITNMKKDNELLRQKLDTFENESKIGNNTKLENLQNQNKKMIDKIEHLTQKCNGLESELVKVHSYKIELENSKINEEELRNQIEELQKLNSDFIEENKQYQKTLQNYEKDIEKLSESISKERKEFENQILNLREDAKKGLFSLEPKIREKLQQEFQQKEEKLKNEFTQKLDELSTTSTLNEINVQLLEKDCLLKKHSEELESARAELSQKSESYHKLEENHLELIEDCTKLRNTIANLEKDNVLITNNEDKIRRLDAHIKTLQEEIEELKKICQNKEETNTYLSNENQNLERELEHVNEKFRLLEEKEETVSVDCSEDKLLELKVQKLEEDKNNLLSEFEMERKMYNDMLKDLDQLKDKEKHMELLKKDLKNCQEEVIQLKQYLAEEKGHNVKLEDKKLQLEQEIRKRKKEINDLKTKLKIEVEEHELLTKTNDDMNRMIESLKKSSKAFEEENEKLQSEKVTLQTLVDNHEHQVLELSTKISSLSEVIEKQSTDFNNLLSQTRELDKVLEKNQKESVEVISKEKEKQTEFKSTIEDLQRRLDAKGEECVNLSQKLIKLEKSHADGINNYDIKVQETESLTKKIQELQHLEEAYRNLELEKRNCDEGILRFKSIECTLGDVRNDLKAKNNELRIKEHENKILQEEKNNLLQEIQDLRTKTQEFELEIKNLKDVSTQLSNSNNKLHQMQSEKDTLQNKIENLNGEISELVLRLHQLSTDNKNILEENQNLSQDRDELKIKLELLENEKNSFVDVEKKLLDEIKNLYGRIEEIQQQLGEVQRQNLELINDKNQSNSSEIDVDTIQKQFYEIKEKCDSLFIENKNLKQEYSNLEEKCNNFSKIKEKLDTQISEMESQYTELLHEKQLLQDEIQELKISPVNHPNPTSSKLEHLQILKKEKEFKLTESERDNLVKEIDILRDKLTKYKSLDLTNKSSIEFYENELQKMKNQNDKLNRKLDETLVTLNHCTELSSTTEVEYLRNVLYNYMLGKESLVLARVIAAVCKFDSQQTEVIMQKEQQKQTLLGHLGLI